MIITDTPIDPFAKISIDTVGPLPMTPDSNKHVFTAQDNLSKYCIGIPIPDFEAEAIADTLARHVIIQFRAHQVILSDKDPAFLGKVAHPLAKILKIA